MALLQPDLNPSEKDLRWFAGLWWPAFAGMVGYLILRKSGNATLVVALEAVAAAIALSGLWSPKAIRPVYRGLMRLTSPIGWVVSHIVLFVFYFGVITPVGRIMRLFVDPMQRRFEPQTTSYWTPREQSGKTEYLRQI